MTILKAFTMVTRFKTAKFVSARQTASRRTVSTIIMRNGFDINFVECFTSAKQDAFAVFF